MQLAQTRRASERVLQSRISQNPLTLAGITLQAHLQSQILVFSGLNLTPASSMPLLPRSLGSSMLSP